MASALQDGDLLCIDVGPQHEASGTGGSHSATRPSTERH